MMVVVTGASGSGKSEYAEGVAVKLAGKGDFILSCDDACLWRRGVRRVERHRKLRAGKDFKRLSVLSRWMKRLQVCMSESLEQTCDTSHGRECTSEFLEQGCARLHGKKYGCPWLYWSACQTLWRMRCSRRLSVMR